MVGNDNQWDDIEYSDDNLQDFDDSEFNEPDDDYSEQDYQDEYEEDYDDDDTSVSSNSGNKSNVLPFLIIFLVLVGVAGFFTLSKMSKSNDNIANNDSIVMEQPVQDQTSQENDDDFFFNQDNNEDVMSIDFSENGEAQIKTDGENGEIVATVKDNDDLFSQTNNESALNNKKDNENNDIIISYDKVARINPFKPPVIEKIQIKDYAKYAEINNTDFEIIEPPVTSVADDNLTKLLQTQISGILYDDVSPSAIVNLDGTDSFVKVGDTIAGFTIKAITKNQVQINYKNNSYIASVGELFTKGNLETKTAVPNLEKKFAGRYKDNN